MQRQEGAKYFTGMPIDILQGQCKDTFAQVMNSGFPGGLMSVDEAVKMMNQGCFKG
jgi:tRNA A37 threonylcarbamoyltransferase TsaD